MPTPNPGTQQYNNTSRNIHFSFSQGLQGDGISTSLAPIKSLQNNHWPHLPGRVKISEVNPSIKHNPRGSNASKILLWIPLIKISGCGCLFLPSRGSWRQPRSSCEPPPTYHPQRPESHEQSPSYSSYKNVYFRSFLRTVSPKGCMVAFDSILQRHSTPA